MKDFTVKELRYVRVLGALCMMLAGCALEDVPLPDNVREAPAPSAPEPEEFALVEGGSFQMGSDDGGSDEKPMHEVTVQSFYLGKHEVTQKEWRAVMGTSPSSVKGESLPVESVSWYEAVEYCNKRSKKEGLTPAYRGSGNSISCDWNANGYRLPTEAEWEYAANGGSKEFLVYKYAGSNSIDAVAWYEENSGNRAHSVGSKIANVLGLYDMSGNVVEWCWDWYGGYSGGAQTSPAGASSGTLRVLRGGSWHDSAAGVRSAGRISLSPSSRSLYIGFRVVRPDPPSVPAPTEPPPTEPPPTEPPPTEPPPTEPPPTEPPPTEPPPVKPVPAGFVLVEGGSFQMGSNNGGRDETPVHSVTVTSFYMGKYEVTQKEWREVMGTSPSNFKGDDLPVETVSWYDAVEYCNKRSQKEGLTPAYRGSGDGISCDWNANGYRLPTEAEWEYAAKGGKGSPGNYEYSGSNDANAVAWYSGNSTSKTHPVGTKASNVLEIYDMSGNVWEWCWDWYGSYSGGAQTDPRGASSGSGRVFRGGSWFNSAADVRSAYRGNFSPSLRSNYLGFRLVRP